MMRSMWSGVAGLKTHQTKMDVIGNNIANVNTTAYKAASINFSELMYQTSARASGPNANTGRAGVNAKQIGLGVQSAAITNKITTSGATQTTGNPFDIRITGDSFFIVSANGDSGDVKFTRDGSFYVDAAGNLAMSANGYNIMGWQVDDKTGEIVKDTVSALRIMKAANMTYPPESTTEAYVDGILDRNEPDAASSAGKSVTLGFYDALGYSYTARFAVHDTAVKGEYTVELADILDSEGRSLVDVYNVNSIEDIADFGGTTPYTSTELRDLLTGVHMGGTSGAYTYTREVSLADAFSDYSDKALPGFTYTPSGTVTSPFTKGSTVQLTGKAELKTADLQNEPYNFVYVTEGAGAPYYHVTVNGTDYDLKDNVGDWQTVLRSLNASYAGLEIDSVALNATTGVVTVTTKPTDFTTADDGTYENGTFTLSIEQYEAYGLDKPGSGKEYDFDVAEDGKAQITTHTSTKGYVLKFDVDTGLFQSINGNTEGNVTLDFSPNATTKTGDSVSLQSFSDINVNWSNVTWFNNGGSSTIAAQSGTEEKGDGAGRKLGAMSGISIQNNGLIYLSYDNGMSKLVGQIAVAKFANASGLEKTGDNLYAATQNSGEFNGIGIDITSDGVGSMSSGVLEMSNVDLSTEFTEMITTQRGFQANSRIITVSDTLLDELINLKR